MIRFTFLIAAAVVLSIGGMIGYLLPLPWVLPPGQRAGLTPLNAFQIFLHL